MKLKLQQFKLPVFVFLVAFYVFAYWTWAGNVRDVEQGYLQAFGQQSIVHIPVWKPSIQEFLEAALQCSYAGTVAGLLALSIERGIYWKEQIFWLPLMLLNAVLIPSIFFCVTGCVLAKLPKPAIRVISAANDSVIFDFRTREAWVGCFRDNLHNQDGITRLEIARVNENGRKVKTYWDIIFEPGVEASYGDIRSSRYLGLIEYSKLPPDWKELVPPHPLDDGAYCVGDIEFFVKRKGRLIILPTVLSDESLANQIRRALN